MFARYTLHDVSISPRIGHNRRVVEAVHTRTPALTRPLVGRERDIEEIRELVLHQGVRLLTLSGPGGVGKTRLALAVAPLFEPEFAEGVRFVDLTPVSEPGLVASAIGRACGLIHDNVDAPLLPLTRALRDRELLLVIDNFEHVVDAATDVGQLLEACPALRVIVTSREPLRLRAESEYPVRPLPLPDLPRAPQILAAKHLEAIAQNPSVALFVQRARAVRPTFALAPDNARALAEVCIRLDGLPLAIELAAARTRFLPANAVALRFERPLDLHAAWRDTPERHRTLRESIAWSYALLSTEQQAVFTRLAVFAGGCSLDAAQAVCWPTLDDEAAADRTFDALADLVERNLLLSEDATDAEPRFRLLETVREFALERLESSGQAAAARAAHAAFYERLVSEAVPHLSGPDQRVWLDALARDLDNVRAALRWLMHVADAEPLRKAAELNWGLWSFWWARGYLSEARRWSAAIMEQPAASRVDRARAAWVASTAALDGGDSEAAPALVAECLGVFRELDDPQALGRALLVDGWAAPIEGDLQRAITSHLESSRQFQRAGDGNGVVLALAGLGNTALLSGDLAASERYNSEALATARSLGDTHSQAQVTEALGLLALERGDLAYAQHTFEQSIDLARAVGGLELVCYGLVGLAGAALGQGALERSAQLFGAAEGLRERAGLGVWPVRRAIEERNVQRLRSALGGRPEVLEQAWTHGRGLSLNAAIELAKGTPATPTPAAAPLAIDVPLTARELEVARLIAKGKTSKEIADELVITERTADTHAAHIRDKLGLRSRAEIAAWAVRQGLTSSNSSSA